MTIKIKTQSEIEKMRIVGKMAANVLEMITPHVKPGVTTAELNDLCHNYIVNGLNAVPAPLNYKVSGHSQPFPKSVCTSVNQVVCHGIPRANEKLKNGNIINIDVTVIHDGYHGDTSKMFFVGNPSNQAEDRRSQRLIKVTQECLYLGIMQAIPGNTLNDIGRAIEQHAINNNYSVVEEYCGHGIGANFHEEPQIMHYETSENNIVIQPGMIFTIEPMINAGGSKIVRINERIGGIAYDWRIETADGKNSAQWEHTILITEKGNEVLTKREEETNLT